MDVLESSPQLERAALVAQERSSDTLWSQEFFVSLGIAAAWTLLAVLFGDKMRPFYSFVFVFGTASTFFFSVTWGTASGLLQAASIFTLMFWANVSAGGDALPLFMAEAPFLALFFAGLALLPNVRPYLLASEIRDLAGQVKELEKKVEELNNVFKQEHKNRVKEKSTEARQLAAKYSSRNTVLVAFVRGVLQASSVREILNLLFYNLTKVYGAQQCAMFLRTSDAKEYVMARVVHPEHQRLENSRVAADLPYFLQMAGQKQLLGFATPTLVTQDIEAEVMFPVLFEKEVCAIFTMSQIKGGGTLSDDERRFVGTLAEFTSAAIEQLKAATTQ